MTKYRKALIVVGAVCVALGKALSDGQITVEEIEVIVGAAATAAGVYLVPNKQ